MNKGWNEIARLGRTGSRYPHVLVDRHGWCLRLAPSHRGEDRFYSTLPSLLEGLMEHFVRRRMADRPGVSTIEDLVKEMRDAVALAGGLARETAAARGTQCGRIPLERTGGRPKARRASEGGRELRRQ